MDKEILVVGSSNIDLILRIPRFHHPGETILAEDLKTAFGGKGANQAIAAKRLGGKVFFLTKLGDDSYGDSYRGYLKKMGLPTQGLLRDKKLPTGLALIELGPKGENRIIVSPGANSSLSPKDLHRHKAIWEKAGFLVMQLEIPITTVKEALQMAKEKGMVTILNPAPATKLPREIFPLVDYLIPNKEEVQIIADRPVKKKEDLPKIAGFLHKIGAKYIIVTLGAEGVYCFKQKEEIWLEAFKVKAVDTTAAGDAFIGGFAWALSKGKALRDALRLASAAGALATTKLGAQPSLPTKKALEDFRRQNFPL
ncbi:MAG: ribokinase [Thermodesulfobacteriota bacterium]